MVNILRVTVNWTGFLGAPGYTVLHGLAPEADPSTNAQTFADAARTLVGGEPGLLPSAVKIDVDPEVQIIEDTTGDLVDVISITPGAQISGTASGPYSGASGAVINWRTATIRNGRRLRGRSFLVPLSNIAYETNGSLTAAAVGALAARADAFWQTPEIQPVIFGRPTQLGNDGMSGPITAASVPDMAAVLRSRRD